MNAAELAAQLDARQTGDGWQARCPAHEDGRASLSIGAGDDGRVLLKCHAGCSITAITGAMSIAAADLFPAKRTSTGRKKIVATYEYPDEDDRVQYEAVRLDPKSFRQRRPDGKGGYVWNMNGVRRVLYALPTLRVRVRDDCRLHNLPDDVFVCEGEKDADRLICRGLVATTNVGGAGKWIDDYSEQLVAAGAKSVVVLPDNDDPGRKHAEDVARSCAAAGLLVKIVALPGLPEKGDVSDFLKAQAVNTDLQNLFAAVDAVSWPATTPTSGTTETVVDLATTLTVVQTFITRYVVLSPEQSALIALWTAQSHLMPAFDYVAYLHIKSPMPECGKTRLLETLEALVAKPWFTGRVTAAVLMRKVDAEHPTLLLDESDAAMNGGDPEYSENLRGMLNSGFHRSGKASCCIGQGANLTFKDFTTYGPKAIAGIGKLPTTVESRSIPIALKRRTKDETVAKFRRRDAWAAAAPIRERLATAGCSALEALRQARPDLPDGLGDRAEDVLEPLFAIADLAGGDWPQTAREAAVALMGYAARVAQEADQSITLELLTDIRDIFEGKDNPEVLPSNDIINGLLTLEDRPWATFTKGDKPITAHRLSRLLRAFDVHPAGNVRVGDKVLKSYRLAAFEEAFARYLPSKPLHRNNANEYGPKPAKTKALHDEPVADSKSAASPDEHSLCSDVALSTAKQSGTSDTEEDDDAVYYGGA